MFELFPNVLSAQNGARRCYERSSPYERLQTLCEGYYSSNEAGCLLIMEFLKAR